MALEYFPCYHSYRKKLAKLSDQEVGRLFRALLEYSEFGETKELTGRESVAFDFIADDIDRAKSAYEEKCEKNRQNGRKGANATKRSQTQANAPQTKSKDKSKDKNDISPNGENNSAVRPPAFATEELRSAFADWLAYKQERRETYKSTGLKNLESEVRNNAAKYGESAVAALIRHCMASNWKGIIFEQLEQKGGRSASPSTRPLAEQQQSVQEDMARMRRMLDACKE